MGTGKTLALAAGIGALCGLRTFTPPAVVSRAARSGGLSLRDTQLELLQSRIAASLLTKSAVGELFADKMPFMISRLGAGSLAGRFLSGALCGAAIAYGRRDRAVAGAAGLGGAAAIAGAFAAYHLRRSLGKSSGAPDPVIAILEDAIAVGGAVAIVRASAD